MCGIAGEIRFDGDSPNQTILETMTATLGLRGPDATGTFIESAVGLGHTRLAIIDLDPRANQPYLNDRWVLSYNGEIFNYKTIRTELKKMGRTFETTCDTEVLLIALDQWGIETTLGKLAGMYAFAAYDRKEKALYLARDRAGIKPLYYYQDDKHLAFGSWPATLLAKPNINWRLDLSALNEFFLLGSPFSGGTLVKNITELMPGHLMKIEGHKVTTKNMWTPEISPRKYDQDEFNSLFEMIVQEHTMSDVPLSLFLSGGIDSSCLAVAIPGIDCFHLHSEEEVYAQIIADHINSKLTVKDMGSASEIDELLLKFSTATGNTFSFPIQSLLISEAMAKTGYKVAFSANGGDELFLGYPRIPSFQDKTSFDLLPFETPSFQSMADQVRHMMRSNENFLIAGQDPTSAYLRSAEFLLDQEQQARDYNLSADASYRFYEIKKSIGHYFNPITDHTSQLYSLEIRVPFLDHRLIEYSLSLPSSDLITEDLGRKAPLKAYLKSKNVFEGVYMRPKLGFSLNAAAKIRLRDQRLDSLQKLSRQGLVQFTPQSGNTFRDFAYISSAAHTFDIWSQAWIDSGRVSL